MAASNRRGVPWSIKVMTGAHLFHADAAGVKTPGCAPGFFHLFAGEGGVAPARNRGRLAFQVLVDGEEVFDLPADVLGHVGRSWIWRVRGSVDHGQDLGVLTFFVAS